MSRDFLLAHVVVIAFIVVVTLPFLPIVMAAAAATAIVVTLILSPVLLLLLAVPAAAADVRPVAANRRPPVAADVRPPAAHGPVADVRPAGAHWRPPVAGEPARLFHLGPDPFRRGQHRGVDFDARGPVRSACSGRVVFAGRVAGAGTVSMRCGVWRVSYAPLTRVAVRAGERVGAGVRLGRAARGIHFGVRREGRRFGYVDPLPFFAGWRAAPPVLGPPRAPRLGRSRPAAHRTAPAPAATLAPWPVWLGLTLLLTGLLGAGRLRLPHRLPATASGRAPSPTA